MKIVKLSAISIISLLLSTIESNNNLPTNFSILNIQTETCEVNEQDTSPVFDHSEICLQIPYDFDFPAFYLKELKTNNSFDALMNTRYQAKSYFTELKQKYISDYQCDVKNIIDLEVSYPFITFYDENEATKDNVYDILQRHIPNISSGTKVCIYNTYSHIPEMATLVHGPIPPDSTFDTARKTVNRPETILQDSFGLPNIGVLEAKDNKQLQSRNNYF